MKLILIILIICISILIGILIGRMFMLPKIYKYKSRISFYKNQNNINNIKLAKIDAVVRTKRNMLLKEQTILINTPFSENKYGKISLQYIINNENVKLIKYLEEAIKNEM